MQKIAKKQSQQKTQKYQNLKKGQLYYFFVKNKPVVTHFQT